MNTSTTVYLLLGIAGFVFHSLLRLKSLSEDARVANMQFNWVRDYIKRDIYGICAAFIAPFIWLLLFGEVAAKYPALLGFSRISFFVMGGLGSYVLQLLLGRAKQQIQKIVDVKTNVSDAVTGGTNSVKETVDKAKAEGYEVEPTKK